MNLWEIANKAVLFSEIVLQGRQLSELELLRRQKSTLLNSQYDMDIVVKVLSSTVFASGARTAFIACSISSLLPP